MHPIRTLLNHSHRNGEVCAPTRLHELVYALPFLLRRATTNSFAGDAVVDVEVSSSDTSEMAAMQGVRCFPMEVTDLLSLWPQANDANMKSMLL